MDSLSIIRSLYAAIGQKNLPTAMALLDPDVIFETPEGQAHVGGKHHGRENAAKSVWGRLAQDWDPIAAEVSDLAALTDSRVLATGRYRGKLRANGAILDADFAHLWSVSNGMVIHLKVFTDTAIWNRVWLGA